MRTAGKYSFRGQFVTGGLGVEYRLQDLVNLSVIQQLLDKLNEALGFPTAIIDNDSVVITASGWVDLCTKFHRNNPVTAEACKKSDQYILQHMHECRPACIYRCPRGLTDCALPIIIEGKHLASFFHGQFFLEKPDLEYFRSQARQYGFAEEDYIKAVGQVRVITQEQLDKNIQFMAKFVDALCEIGSSRLREIESMETGNRLQFALTAARQSMWEYEDLLREISERKMMEEALRKSEEQFRLIFESSQDIYFRTDSAGNLILVNPSITTILGYEPHEVLGSSGINCFKNKADRDALLDLLRKTHQVNDIEVELRANSGQIIYASLTAHVTEDNVGQFTGVEGFLRDITRRKQSDAAIIEAQQKYADLVNNLTLGVYRTALGSGGRILEANPAMVSMFEAGSKEDLMKYSAREFYGSENSRIESSSKLLKDGCIRDEEIEMQTLNGRKFWARINAKIIKREDQCYIDGFIEDITERKKIQDKLHELSIIDELTGLYNRRGFFTLAEQQIKVATRLNQRITLIYADLDGMKQINDNYGHAEGDQALIDTANIFKLTFRASDIIARIGGDEFAALVLENHEDAGITIENRFSDNLLSHNLNSDKPYPLSISLGVVRFEPDQARSLDKLLAQADKLMYEQKQQKQLSR